MATVFCLSASHLLLKSLCTSTITLFAVSVSYINLVLFVSINDAVQSIDILSPVQLQTPEGSLLSSPNIETTYCYKTGFRELQSQRTFKSSTSMGSAGFGASKALPWLRCTATQSIIFCLSSLSTNGRLSHPHPPERGEKDHILGTTSSMESGARLNGSVGSDKRWDLIVDRSIVVFDDGNTTGSRISVYIKGSV